ncbi:CbrC family protein [Streptomyces sp. A1-5]|nr:CbrC family protein [Streptomyces sp. A1-5]UJB47112.1 CbrC family protein [Streptomyces sp. A1-5]
MPLCVPRFSFSAPSDEADADALSSNGEDGHCAISPCLDKWSWRWSLLGQAGGVRAAARSVRTLRLLRSLVVTDSLPEFPYHPHPMTTGAVVASDILCVCCGRGRGYIYTGPVYAVDDLDDRLCPWCIADGSAAEQYEADFVGGLIGDDVPVEVFMGIAGRTPGFPGWQEPQWFFHCGDGAAFLGAVGAAELEDYPDAVEVLRQEASSWGWSAAQVEDYLNALDKDGQPTAYLFRCRACATHLAYSDFT